MFEKRRGDIEMSVFNVLLTETIVFGVGALSA